MLFGIPSARAMTIQASGSRGRDLRGRTGLDFHIQREAISCQHASGNIVQMN